MFDKETFLAMSQGHAIERANTFLDTQIEDGRAIALPDGFNLQSLETYNATRRRARGKMRTQGIASFAEYTLAHAEEGACIFVSQDEMTATAILNLGTPEAPGHADNTAVLLAKKTAAFKALLAVADGSGKKQATIAEFVEDWGAGNYHIACFDSDGNEITVSRAVQALRSLSIETVRKLESDVQQLSAHTSALESVATSSKSSAIPVRITFRCEPYNDLTERTFEMRLSITTSDSKPSLVLRIIKLEQHQEGMADNFAKLISINLDTENGQVDKEGDLTDDHGIPVLIGSYEAIR